MWVGKYIVLFFTLIFSSLCIFSNTSSSANDKHFQPNRLNFSSHQCQLLLIDGAFAYRHSTLSNNSDYLYIMSRFLQRKVRPSKKTKDKQSTPDSKTEKDPYEEDQILFLENLFKNVDLSSAQLLAAKFLEIQQIDSIYQLFGGIDFESVSRFLDERLQETEDERIKAGIFLSQEHKTKFKHELDGLDNMSFENFVHQLFKLDQASYLEGFPLAFQTNTILDNPYLKILLSKTYAATELNESSPDVPILLTNKDLSKRNPEDFVLATLLKVEFNFLSTITPRELTTFKETLKHCGFPLFEFEQVTNHIPITTYYTYYAPQDLEALYQLPYVDRLHFSSETISRKVSFLRSLKEFK